MENQELLKMLRGMHVCFLFNDWFCAREILRIYIERLEKNGQIEECKCAVSE